MEENLIGGKEIYYGDLFLYSYKLIVYLFILFIILKIILYII